MDSRGDHSLTDRFRGRVPWRNVPRSWSSKSLSTHSARCFALMCAMALISVPAAAQDEPRAFAGALFGVSALSADAQAVTTGADAAVSLYDPKNGLALNVFGGFHVAQYFAIQVNWMWNRNDLTLVSSYTSPQAGGFYEQTRDSSQHALVFDGLIYFRRLDSSIRPYLGTGLSIGVSPAKRWLPGARPDAACGRDQIHSHRSAFTRGDRLQAVASSLVQVQLQ